MKKGTALLLNPLIFVALTLAAQQTSPAHLTSEQDHQRTMDLLHVKSLRNGVSGDPKSPSAANYDESKAGPFTKLPDPLRFDSGKDHGKEVKTAKQWWAERRPQIDRTA